MKITCEVIKDLLPSYVDGLTSLQSNQLIEEHLDTCKDCREFLAQMQEEVPAPAAIRENQKAIRPFRKLKRRALAAVGAAVLICVLLFGAGTWYYTQTWMADSSDVTMTTETFGGIADFRFTPENKNHVLSVEISETEPYTLVITESRRLPFQKSYQASAYYSLTFLDENTIAGLNGETIDISANDTLTIQYQDQVQTLSLSQLAQDSLENPLAEEKDVTMSYSQNDQGQVTLTFTPVILGVSLQVEEEGTNAIRIRQIYNGAEEPQNTSASYTITFLDENTLLLSDGSRQSLSETDALTIVYQDGEQTFSYESLRTGSGL